MTVGLFIPCYVDQFYPQVAIATLQLLEKLGCEVHYPLNQTCCEQPMANSGFGYLTDGCNQLFADNFKSFDYIVCPSGSCVLHIKEHWYNDKIKDEAEEILNKIYELTKFLTDVLQVKNLTAFFPHKVGVHQSCHGQRGLHISQMDPVFKSSYPADLFARLQAEKYGDVQPGDMDEIKSAKTDFLGINYYSVNMYHEKTGAGFFGLTNGNNPDNPPMFNGFMNPAAFTEGLKSLKQQYNNPEIIVTENGARYGSQDDTLVNGKVHDSLRTNYLQRHIKAVNDTIKQGVNVRGYFVWSMFDNLE